MNGPQDGTNHGLHNFLVPIRDPKSLLPYPGVIIGDMGHKIGLNGVDNGFMMFDHYKVPREALLNRTGDVNSEGQYKTPYKVRGRLKTKLTSFLTIFDQLPPFIDIFNLTLTKRDDFWTTYLPTSSCQRSL